jgi:hypothetical protein
MNDVLAALRRKIALHEGIINGLKAGLAILESNAPPVDGESGERRPEPEEPSPPPLRPIGTAATAAPPSRQIRRPGSVVTATRPGSAPRVCRFWSLEEIDSLHRMYEVELLPIAEIANRLGRRKSEINSKLRYERRTGRLAGRPSQPNSDGGDACTTH